MKGNYGSLVEFAHEVERVEMAAADYVAPAEGMMMLDDDNRLVIGSRQADVADYGVNQYAHGQIADKLGIPRRFYNEIEKVEGLRAHNVNTLLRHEGAQGKRYLVRTLDGDVRALLSDRYRPIGNAEIMKSLLPVLREIPGGQVRVVSQGMSDTKMYVQVIFPGIKTDVLVGDEVQAGLTISNSEVGAGTFTIQGLVWRLVCKNGMILPSVVKERHVGRRLSGSDDEAIEWRPDTVAAEQTAYMKIIRDVFNHVISSEWLEKQVAPMRAATRDNFVRVQDTVERTVKRLDLRVEDHEPILKNLFSEGNGLTRWGLANSITAMAHDIENPDRQFEYEEAGYKLLCLSGKDWAEIAA